MKLANVFVIILFCLNSINSEVPSENIEELGIDCFTPQGCYYKLFKIFKTEKMKIEEQLQVLQRSFNLFMMSILL